MAGCEWMKNISTIASSLDLSLYLTHEGVYLPVCAQRAYLRTPNSTFLKKSALVIASVTVYL